MIVYVVIVSTGEWKDKSKDVDSVFSDKEQAMLRCFTITNYHTQMINSTSPHSEEDYYENKLSEQEDAEYASWQSLVNVSNDFNCVTIEEYELNAIPETI